LGAAGGKPRLSMLEEIVFQADERPIARTNDAPDEVISVISDHSPDGQFDGPDTVIRHVGGLSVRQ
jgi:hypothetical protein